MAGTNVTNEEGFLLLLSHYYHIHYMHYFSIIIVIYNLL